MHQFTVYTRMTLFLIPSTDMVFTREFFDPSGACRYVWTLGAPWLADAGDIGFVATCSSTIFSMTYGFDARQIVRLSPSALTFLVHFKLIGPH